MLRYYFFWMFSCLSLAAGAQSTVVAPEIITEQTKFQEGYPWITPDGQTLYFVRNRHPRNQGANNQADIWLRLKQADGSWGRALNAGGPINSFSDDRLIGLSADGRRLAVLRMGAGSNYLDILEKVERSWRILHSQSLEDFVTEGLTACFDLSSNELIYSRLNDGQYDLFRRKLDLVQGWLSEEKLGLLNSAEDERHPYLSPDGGSLYFRRSGSWQLGNWLPQRSTYGADQPMGNDIASSYQSISLAIEPSLRLYASMVNAEGESRLIATELPAPAQPRASKLLRGWVSSQNNPVLSGALAIGYAIDQRSLTFYPGKNGAYAVVVPAELEQLKISTPGFLLSQPLQANDDKEVDATVDYNRRQQSIVALNQEIAITANEVARLRKKRKELSENVRRDQLAAGQELLAGYIDPELAKLRSQVTVAQSNLADTLPPASQPLVKKPTIRREENAAAIDELAALRNRFRTARQALGDDTERDWTSNDPITVRKSAARQLNEELIPTISEEIVRGVYAEQQIDSLSMEQSIRSSLFITNRPAVYEREPWENELIENIDPSARQVLRDRLQATVESSALADQAIQRQLSEREARLQMLQDSLNAQLAIQEGALPNNASPTPSTYQTPVVEPQPFVRDQGLAVKGGSVLLPSFPLDRTVTLGQLRFAPNSAYFKPGTTEELDRLAKQLTANPALKAQIMVHANTSVSPTQAQLLTDQRATSILNYLSLQGLPADRVKVLGMGSEQAIADSNTPEGRLKNQRVEVTVY